MLPSNWAQRRLGFGVALAGMALLTGSVGCSSDSAAKSGTATEASAGEQKATAPAFRDVTAETGIDYTWSVQGKRPLNILQTIGNGAGFIDYDNDGNLDILLVGPRVALYRGDGRGKFTDVSEAVGLTALKGNFLGCATGDYDNDGYSDIYLTAYRGGALLHNDGGKKLTDVTAKSGIASQPWGTSAAFGDVNGDGHLDLFIGNYVVFGPDTDPQLCDNQGIKTSCGPRFYKPERSHLYLGSASGKFTDVTQKWKADLVEGKALGVAIADYDGTGKLHLALANDEMPGDLLQNKGGIFENIGKTSGTAYDDSGNVHGGMGVDWGDYDNDGRQDLAVGTFQNETKNIYHNDGEDLFTDRSAMLGLSSATPLVTFGLKWLDYDNDGWLDLMLANGHVQDNIAEIEKTNSYRQPTRLYHNEQGKRFADVSATALGESGQRPLVGRGLAVGDYDNDGRVDALVVDSEGSPLLLHNESAAAGNWLLIRLQGTKSNRDGLGARVEVRVGERVLLRHCASDGSYMSASDKRVHIGLGAATAAESVTVHWPGGGKTTLENIPANAPLLIKEQ